MKSHPIIVSPTGCLSRRVFRRFVTASLVALCLTVALAADADDISSSVENTPTDRPAIIVVVGAAGSDEFGEQFSDWAEQWKQLAANAGAKWTLIGGGTPLASDDSVATDRQRLQSAIDQLDGQNTTPVWFVLIGHGTYAQQTAKFNLSGPDVSAADLSNWLAPVNRPLVIANCASASGPFINRLSGNRRVIVTASKSGSEQNFARFGRFFSSAIGSSDADLDHDDEVSVHEAFLRASTEVSDFYEAEGRISTEHALIDDNGDGRGTPAKMFRGVRPIAKAKDGVELDGRLAARITLAPTKDHLTLTPSEQKRRDSLEQQLEQLRQQRNDLEEDAYDELLEPLMIRLAKIYRAAEKRKQSLRKPTPASTVDQASD